MANQVSDYQRGEMDIQEQAATFDRVMAMTKWGSLVIAVAVLFLTLWFCTSVGFLSALATSVVAAVLGGFFLRGGGH
jgi:hypothetical protein